MSGRPRRDFRLPRSGSASDEVDDEIRAHLELRAEELEREGWTPEAAREEALRRFGSIDEARRMLGRTRRARDRRLGFWSFVEGILADLTVAARRARGQPAHAVFTVLTLGLGIALTTSSFTVVERVLLRPLAFPEADRLVSLQSATREGEFFPQVSSTAWHDWTNGTRIATSATVFRAVPATLQLPDGPVRQAIHQVSPEFFAVLRPTLTQGRALGEADADARVAVVSASFWRDRLGSPALPAQVSIVGSTHDVVGVVDDATAYPVGAEVWTATAPREMTQPGARNLINWAVVARLPAGVDPAALKAELDRVSDRVRAEDPTAVYAWQVGVEPLHSFLLGETDRQIWLLLGATFAVWLLAWLNLAGLSLARTEARVREVSVRLALGADRRRVVRQILTEHLLIGFCGGIVGLLAAAWLMVALEPFLTANLPVATSVRVGATTVAFALGLAVVTGLLAGLVPAVRAGRMGSRGSASVGSSLRSRGRRDRVGAALVVSEVALALTLLVSGGLLVQSFRSLTARDLGFETAGVWVTEVALDLPDYAVPFGEGQGEGVEARRRFWSELLSELQGDGRIVAAGAGWGAPMVGSGRGFIEVDGRPAGQIGAGYRAVAGDYFQALSVATVAGRLFDRSDGPDTERVVVINESMADEFWPGQSPIGRRVRALSMERGRAGEEAPWLRVVGVVSDVRTYGFDSEPTGEMFVLAEQVPASMRAMTLVVRGRVGARDAIPTLLRDAVGRRDARLSVNVQPLERRVFNAVSDRAALTSFVVVFGALAVILACVGLYGLLSYVVTRRTREMGIRAALGAQRGRIVGLVVGRSLVIVIMGLGLGLLGAYSAAGVLRSQLVDTPPHDPWAYLVGGSALLAAALVAALLPAHRASRADPLIALRADEG